MNYLPSFHRASIQFLVDFYGKPFKVGNATLYPSTSALRSDEIDDPMGEGKHRDAKLELFGRLSLAQRKRAFGTRPIVTSEPVPDVAFLYATLYEEHEKERENPKRLLSRKVGNVILSDREVVNEILSRNGMIAGSYPLSVHTGSVFSDIDVFVRSKEDFNELHKYLIKNSYSAVFFKHSILYKLPDVNVNLIARIYKSEAELLYGFDIPMSQILLSKENGELVLKYTPIYRFSVDNKYVAVDGSRMSPTYFHRLKKYWSRKVVDTIYFPEFDDVIKPHLLRLPLRHQAWALMDLGRREYNADYEADPPASAKSDGTPRVQRIMYYNDKFVKIMKDDVDYESQLIKIDGKFIKLEFRQDDKEDKEVKTNEKAALKFVEFIYDNPGKQISSTIFPTPVVGHDGWVKWINDQIR